MGRLIFHYLRRSDEKKAVINMQNKDDQCFKWAVTRALHPVDNHRERVTAELCKQAETLNWKGIEFPTPCFARCFDKLSKNNNISVLVFAYDGKKIIPLYVPKVIHEKVVRLFFQKDGDQTHYCVVKGMSRLVASQVSKKKAKKFMCDYCLNFFGTMKILESHTEC